MFNADFYPTPRAIARKMVARISSDAKYFLEPSAGKGDLADVIRRPTTYEEFEADHGREVSDRESRRFSRDEDRNGIHIDVIEQHPALSAVLRSKNHSVVGYEWLEYNGTSYYDAVCMNPPFSEGAKHLLKAWDFLHNGEIVCLLNEETIKNPYTEERKRLVAIIAEHGDIEYLGDCFSTAERKTDVRVAMVYLKKVAPDDTADMWATEFTPEKEYHFEVGNDPNMIAIRDKLGNMEQWYNMANSHWVKGIEHLRKARLYMNQNKVGDYNSSGNRDSDFKQIAGMALDNAHTSRAEFLRRHRLMAWKSVFEQMEFNKWLDSKQQDRFMRDVERDSTIPFTAENIKGTLENVFLQRSKLFEESVANVFDELTKHHAGNSNVSSEGWKTNDSYKVNERLVFPYGCRYDAKFGASFNTAYGSADTIYSDLDRILCVLDAQPFEKCYTVNHALRTSFDRLNRSHQMSGSGWNEVESEYFEIRFFKKGTVHLKWKRHDLLEAFNKTAAAGKKWLGENTQKDRPTKTKRDDLSDNWECRTNGCEFKDGFCVTCEVAEIGPLDLIECDLCRAVMEATGVEECPLHPLPINTIQAASPLLLTASDQQQQ